MMIMAAKFQVFIFNIYLINGLTILIFENRIFFHEGNIETLPHLK